MSLCSLLADYLVIIVIFLTGKMMKNWVRILLSISVLCVSMVNNAYTQGYNQDRTALNNFIVRMYNNAPFEGVKIVDDYDNTYILSAVNVNGTQPESAANRIAQVKNNRQMSQYLGGLVEIDSETIIKTTEDAESKHSISEITDIIKEQSIGFTKSMEIIATIDRSDGQKCYLFLRNINDMK